MQKEFYKHYRLHEATIVRPDDVLNITIQTLDPTANTILNQGNLPVNSGAVTGVKQ